VVGCLRNYLGEPTQDFEPTIGVRKAGSPEGFRPKGFPIDGLPWGHSGNGSIPEEGKGGKADDEAFSRPKYCFADLLSPVINWVSGFRQQFHLKLTATER
jgi:hypothetical protein